MNTTIKTIAFDADDTLWVNEPYFQDAEQEFCTLLADYLPQDSIKQALFETEMKNLTLYGYGVKGFVLCMIETANRISNNSVPAPIIADIITLGHELLEKPIELLDAVSPTLEALQGKYRLIVATKGDLLDQERKLKKSGIADYFHHIEIMSDKTEQDYRNLLKHLDCNAENFLMIGNSLKSDILPVLEIGSYAAHIPYHVTWTHEQVAQPLDHPHFCTLHTISEVLCYLEN